MKRSASTHSLRRGWRVVAGATALALGAASCGSGSTEAAGVDEQPSAQTTQAAVVATTASGGQIDFGALEGNDYVLWFWAPW